MQSNNFLLYIRRRDIFALKEDLQLLKIIVNLHNIIVEVEKYYFHLHKTTYVMASIWYLTVGGILQTVFSVTRLIVFNSWRYLTNGIQRYTTNLIFNR
jgi:hypothetical protein